MNKNANRMQFNSLRLINVKKRLCKHKFDNWDKNASWHKPIASLDLYTKLPHVI